ncbi:P-loop containing nucleoside triphosphate hydrolase protein [Rhodofomes roseus]|uniref:DNA 3'-5' helicase n=1 Tax=Rhodofomes roseus TaxID=34475 RepID=A0ABQ8KGP2_9APHY|nr:P-loop containing nucleoside triphosphate hydrolase protein [Rhodofomes roseus]KAH9836597.1 P-loop containing nucleoside triphosphate hydrolase protein [Rhodofomes roseus]
MLPRHKDAKRHGWAQKRRDKAVKGRQRRPLTEDDVSKLSVLMENSYHWKPRTFQVEGVRAQLEGVDTIIQAPTGSGKTAIAAGVHLWPDGQPKVTIMVSPLLALEDEMVTTFKDQFGLNAIAVSSQHGSCSPAVVKDILALKYQIILASPEMLQSRTFINRILRNSKFTRNIISLVVDEAHCVSHWGADFRKKYASLGVIRAFLPRGTPVIAVTATLTGRVRRDIQSKLHFPKRGSRFINMGNDRSNVSLVVRAAEHPLNTYRDLEFVVPQSAKQASDIPKTWIYVDNINTGTEIIDYLVKEVRSRTTANPDTTLSADCIRPFNATLSPEYRTAAMAAFREGSIRIMVCTEAAGMGCDIADIDVVVQWKLPGTFSNFVQRAGRAARGRGRQGLAVLIVERTAYTVDLSALQSTDESNTGTHGKGNTSATVRGRKRKTAPQVKAGKDYAELHGVNRGGSSGKDAPPQGTQPPLDPESLDEGLHTFVQSTHCRRRVWAEVFESPYKSASGPCCDICDSTLFNRTRPSAATKAPKAARIPRGVPDVKTELSLYEWRDDIFIRDHAKAQYDSTAILDDATIERLASAGCLPRNTLTAILKSTWIWWDRYGAELTSHMESLDVVFTPPPKKAKAGQTTMSLSSASATVPLATPSTRAGNTQADDSSTRATESQPIASGSTSAPALTKKRASGADLDAPYTDTTHTSSSSIPPRPTKRRRKATVPTASTASEVVAPLPVLADPQTTSVSHTPPHHSLASNHHNAPAGPACSSATSITRREVSVQLDHAAQAAVQRVGHSEGHLAGASGNDGDRAGSNTYDAFWGSFKWMSARSDHSPRSGEGT